MKKYIELISKINCKKYLVEEIENSHIVFTILLFKDTYLMITFPYEYIDMEENEVVYCLFKKTEKSREIIVHNNKSIYDVIKGANEYVKLNKDKI